jgi:hypothetical protein
MADWHARMGPKARALYIRFERMIRACGSYHVAPAQSRIAFLGQVRFAGITGISENGMTCSFSLPYALRSERFAKVEEVAPGWWVHRLRITESRQLDQQLQGWLRQSYRLMGMRERFAKEKNKKKSQ